MIGCHTCFTKTFVTLIVLCVGYCAKSASTNEQPTQYVLFNANIYTMESQTYRPPQQAIAVLQGRILEVGTNEDLLAKYPTFEHIDVDGHTILPGLIDAHVHLSSEGIRLSQVILRGCLSEAECVDRVKAFVLDNNVGPGEWIQGRGWDQTMFPGQEWPSKVSLDEVFPENPISFIDTGGHAIWANSASMSRVSIPDDDPEGGEIQRDEFGEPTGIFIDTAMDIIRAIEPPVTDEDLRSAYILATERCQQFGLTGVHMAGDGQRDVEIIQELIGEGLFDVRAYVMLSGLNEDLIERYCTGPSPDPQLIEYGDGRLTIRSMKVVMDGALTSKGAAMIDNYIGEDHNGLMRLEPEEYLPYVETWASCGYQVNTHCIGDRCNRDILNVYERVFSEHPDWRDLRFRIEHAEVLTEADVPRFATLGVLPSVQPTHFTDHMRFTPDIIGEDNTRFAFIAQTFLDLGVIMPFGSDFPAISEVDPMEGLYAAISRQHPDGTPPGGYQPHERISIWDAVRGFTYHAAYGAFEEDRVGTLETGKRADLIILSDNIIEEADNNFQMVLNTRVLVTIFNGNCVYSAGSRFKDLC